MVTCTQCETLNGVDGKFCKNCGQPLPEEQLKEVIAREETLVADGFSKLNGGMISDAAMCAEAVLAENPRNAHALSLLGMCFERQDDIAQAIECYEKVLEINPDSPLEKIKVGHLRKALATQLAVRPKDSQKLAYLGASAAGLLVVAGAAMIAVLNSKPVQAAEQYPGLVASNTSTKKDDAAPFEQIRSASLTQEPRAANVNPNVAQPGGNPAATTQDVQPIVNNQERPAPSTTNTGTTSQLPRPESNGRPANLEGDIAPPVKVEIPSNIKLVPTDEKPSQREESKDPDPEPAESSKPEVQKPAENPGIIEIRRSNPNRPIKGSGSQDVSQPSGNGTQALLRTAREQYMLGKYDNAARTYERALESGANAGSVNQRLGQCYEKLGRQSEAISAYSKAVNYYEGASKSDGSKSQALEACKQALKVLKGG